jgi:hypothetical protein
MSGIFAVSVVPNGLYGPVWAVGAVVLGIGDGHPVTATFEGQLRAGEATDDWTRENVVPVVHPPEYPSRAELLESFWAFWVKHGPGAVCVADGGHPAVAELFRACVHRGAAARWNKGPHPLHELSTALWAVGADPGGDRREFCGRPDLVPRDPVDDATAAALCWAKVAKMRAGNG